MDADMIVSLPRHHGTVRDALTRWMGTAGETQPDVVQGAKECLVAALDHLLAEGIEAIEANAPRRVEQVAELLCETYAWGGDDTLGFNFPAASGTEDILSCGVPSIEALARLCVLGAMAAKMRRLPICRQLATGHAVLTVHGDTKPMPSHPFRGRPPEKHWSAPVFFGLSGALLEAEPDSFVVPPPRRLLDALCGFDLLVQVYTRCAHPTLDACGHFPNYARYDASRVWRIAVDLVLPQYDEDVLAPLWQGQTLADALQAPDARAVGTGGCTPVK